MGPMKIDLRETVKRMFGDCVLKSDNQPYRTPLLP
jgi:hypothetical protein